MSSEPHTLPYTLCPHLLHISKSGGNLVSLNPTFLQPSPAVQQPSPTVPLSLSKSLQNTLQTDFTVKRASANSSAVQGRALVPSCSGLLRSDSPLDTRWTSWFIFGEKFEFQLISVFS